MDQLEITAPVNRARVRLAVIAYMKRYHTSPPIEVRKMVYLQFGGDALDGYDEGVDLGMCYVR